jgi:hypothetical protein
MNEGSQEDHKLMSGLLGRTILAAFGWSWMYQNIPSFSPEGWVGYEDVFEIHILGVLHNISQLIVQKISVNVVSGHPQLSPTQNYYISMRREFTGHKG